MLIILHQVGHDIHNTLLVKHFVLVLRNVLLRVFSIVPFFKVVLIQLFSVTFIGLPFRIILLLNLLVLLPFILRISIYAFALKLFSTDLELFGSVLKLISFSLSLSSFGLFPFIFFILVKDQIKNTFALTSVKSICPISYNGHLYDGVNLVISGKLLKVTTMELPVLFALFNLVSSFG